MNRPLTDRPPRIWRRPRSRRPIPGAGLFTDALDRHLVVIAAVFALEDTGASTNNFAAFSGILATVSA